MMDCWRSYIFMIIDEWDSRFAAKAFQDLVLLPAFCRPASSRWDIPQCLFPSKAAGHQDIPHSLSDETNRQMPSFHSGNADTSQPRTLPYPFRSNIGQTHHTCLLLAWEIRTPKRQTP